MLGRLISLCRHPGASGTPSGRGGWQDHGADKVEAFYAGLAEGLKILEESVGRDPPIFSLESLSLAVDCVHSLHSKLEFVIEQLWVPVRSTIGVDVLNMYLEVSKNLLDMCNFLKDGVGQLESCQMSLEHALTSLASAVESLSFQDDDHDSRVRRSVQACKDELERMEAKKSAPALWDDFISKLEQAGGGGGLSKVGSDKKKKELSLKRSVSVLPTSSLEKKASDISRVMMDAEVVTIFLSYLLLWVLTDSTEKFRFALDLGTKHGTNGQSDWSAPLRKLTEKVQDAESKDNNGEGHRVNSLREFEDLRISTCELREKIEVGLKQEGPTGCRKELLEDSTAVLEKTRGKLSEILGSSERLAVQTSDIFLEILSSRKKLLDVVEKRLIRSPTM